MANRFCANCGNPVNDDMRFCINCGHNLSAPDFSAKISVEPVLEQIPEQELETPSFEPELVSQMDDIQTETEKTTSEHHAEPAEVSEIVEERQTNITEQIESPVVSTSEATQGIEIEAKRQAIPIEEEPTDEYRPKIRTIRLTPRMATPAALCQVCGSAVETYMKFCIRCGSQVSDIANAQLKPQSAPITPYQRENETEPRSKAYQQPVKQNYQKQGWQANQTYSDALYRQSELTNPASHAWVADSGYAHDQGEKSKRKKRDKSLHPVPSGALRRDKKSLPIFGSKKALFISLGAFLLLVVIVAVAVLFLNRRPVTFAESPGAIASIGSEAIIPVGGKPFLVDGYIRMTRYSKDASKMFVLASENSNEYILYHVDGPVVTEVSDNVVNAIISKSGDRGAIISKNGDLKKLSYFANGKLTDIDTGADEYFMTLSPDGKTLAYSAVQGGLVEAYLWDGKLTELGQDLVLLLVADQAKSVYFIVEPEKSSSSARASTVYVQKGAVKESRQPVFNSEYRFSYPSVIANKDLSEVMLSDGTQSVFVKNNEVKSELSKRSLWLTGKEAFSMAWMAGWGQSENYILATELDTLANQIYYQQNSNSIVFIDKSYDVRRITSNADQFSILPDMKTVYYKNNNSLYKVDGRNANASPEQIERRRVMWFFTLDNGHVYYVDDGNSLYFMKNGKAEFVDDVRHAEFNAFGSKLFYVIEGVLKVADGGRASEVRAVNDDVVPGVQFGGTLAFQSRYEKRYFYTTDGNTFTDVIF